MEWLVGRQVGLLHGILAVCETRNVGDQGFFPRGIGLLEKNDLCRDLHPGKIRIREALSGEVN